MAEPCLHVTTLGETTVRSAGQRLRLTPAERTIVAALAVHAETGVTVPHLMTILWPGEPPRTAKASLHNHIVRLRRKLPGTRVLHERGRYRLDPRPTTDLAQRAELLQQAQVALESGAPARAAALLPAPTGLLQRHLEDLEDDPRSLPLARAADDQLVEVHRLRAAALIEAGQLHRATAELELLVQIHPGHEGLWTLLVTAVAASGRRMDAIAAYRRAHRTLTATYGLCPGPELQELHEQLLRAGGERPSGVRSVVGRRAELTTCQLALRGGGTVLVVGGAGAGRTTLLQQLAGRWDGPAVMIACSDNPWHPLSPIVDLEAALRGGRGPAAATTAGRADRHGVDELLHRASAAVAATRGLLVVLDDADLLGPFSALLLAQVLGRSGAAVIASSRAELTPVPGRQDRQTVTLGALRPGEVADLIGGGPESATAAAELVRLTGGTPGRLVKVLTEASAAGVDVTTLVTHPDIDQLPAGLRDALLEVVAGLPPPTREALEVLAVLEDPVPLQRVARLTAPAALEAPLADGLLTCDARGRIGFASRLLRRLVYDHIPDGRRQEWHCLAWVTADDAPGRHRHAPALRHCLRRAVDHGAAAAA